MTVIRRRGITRVDELWAAGAMVGVGHDSVMDPWYRLGTANMLDAAYMLVHGAQLTGEARCRASSICSFRPIISHLAGYLNSSLGSQLSFSGGPMTTPSNFPFTSASPRRWLSETLVLDPRANFGPPVLLSKGKPTHGRLQHEGEGKSDPDALRT